MKTILTLVFFCIPLLGVAQFYKNFSLEYRTTRIYTWAEKNMSFYNLSQGPHVTYHNVAQKGLNNYDLGLVYKFNDSNSFLLRYGENNHGHATIVSSIGGFGTTFVELPFNLTYFSKFYGIGHQMNFNLRNKLDFLFSHLYQFHNTETFQSIEFPGVLRYSHNYNVNLGLRFGHVDILSFKIEMGAVKRLSRFNHEGVIYSREAYGSEYIPFMLVFGAGLSLSIN